MSIILWIYILLCIALLLFDIFFLLFQNRRSLVAYRKNDALERQLREAIAARQDAGAFPPDFTETLPRKLSKTRNLLTLQEVIEDDPLAKTWFRPYVMEKMGEYARKSDGEQAYFTYLLSTFDYTQETPSAASLHELLGFLDTKSLYTFSNTMNCLYAIGEVSPLIEAMEKIDARTGFYHKKLLVDGLLSVRANVEALDKRLAENFSRYSPQLQECLLDYFRLRGCDAAGLCMRVLKNDKSDPQVRYTAMRYFAKYPNRESYAYLMESLGNEEATWVQQLLAIQGLQRYDTPAVRAAISEKVTSANWHVRINAVKYLHDHGMDRNEILEILERRDRYTNEALLYQYRDDAQLSRYIQDTIRLLQEQEDEAAAGRKTGLGARSEAMRGAAASTAAI